jgi:hypothetical protein
MSPLSPAHTYAICFPSKERAGFRSTVGELVSGVVLNPDSICGVPNPENL